MQGLTEADVKGPSGPTAADYEAAGRAVGELVARKQQAYGDSFSRSKRIMKVLYPNGIPVEQYQSTLTIIRIIDKLFRIATNDDPFQEDPWKDIAGYALLETARIQNDRTSDD